MKRHALEHFIWEKIKKLEWNKKSNVRILVGLSGGVDSMALLNTLVQTVSVERVSAAYFHHGVTTSQAQQNYRWQAQHFCRQWCADKSILFYTNELDLKLEAHQELQKEFHGESKVVPRQTSEELQRKARYQFFKETMERGNFSVLALGHHLDDLLETRLLRLIRGTGLQGLESMKVWDGTLFRPFLEITKQKLEAYLQELRIPTIEDPSNGKTDPLRNWLRQDWLLQLERRCPGSVARLGHSLQNILTEAQVMQHQLKDSRIREFTLEEGIDRVYFVSLPESEKIRLLAKYLFEKKYHNFGRAHLEEVVKRLDNSQKELNFRVARLNWIVNAAQIKVES